MLPDTVLRLQKLMADQHSNLDEMAELVSFDPVLSAKLLRTANSAMYRFPTEVETVTKAIQVVGTLSMYDLVIGHSVTKAFAACDRERINLEQFWEVSVHCGLLAKYLAEWMGQRQTEKWFVCGLLHNIGELVVRQAKPEYGIQCAELIKSQPPQQKQKEILGFTYFELGAALLQYWGIPDSLFTLIASLAETLNPTDSSNIESNILKVAYLLMLEVNYPKLYPQGTQFSPELMETMGLDQAAIDEVVNKANSNTLAVLKIFIDTV
jgi:HD-like signal output (HDOD) protein